MGAFGARCLRAVLTMLLLVAWVFPADIARAGDRHEGQPFHWNGRVAAGKVLEIRGINGGIRAGLAPGANAVVDAEKWGRRNDPDQVKIDVTEDAEGVTVCARYPKRWGGLSDCRGGGIGHNDVVVEFTVQVPAGVEVRLATVNGAIGATGLRNRVHARTVNGAVRVDTSDEAEVTTVNGSITARSVPRGGELAFRTVNGSIRLELPSGTNAHVSAHTVNGSISSDFPVTIRGGWIGRRLEGTIGRGGADLELHTVNGSIQLRQI